MIAGSNVPPNVRYALYDTFKLKTASGFPIVSAQYLENSVTNALVASSDSN